MTTLIEVTTLGEDLFLSKTWDAIMTLHGRQRLYGDPKYYNVGRKRWKDRERHSEPTCSLISFKAKLNANPRVDGEDRHKFSYNVRIKKQKSPYD